LLSTTITSYASGGAVWSRSALSAQRSAATRLNVGRMMLRRIAGIGPPPFVRRVKVPAYRFSGFNGQHAPPVPPVDGAGAPALADGCADGVDPGLQSHRLARELEAAASRRQAERAAAEGGALLAVQRASVSRVIEHLDDRVMHQRGDVDVDKGAERISGAGAEYLAPVPLQEPDVGDACHSGA